MLKNSRTSFWFNKYESYQKNVINKTILFFYFTVVPQNFGLNQPIGYRDTKFVEKISSILYDYLLKTMTNIEKSSSAYMVLFFDFTSVYKILCNFINWMKSCK